MNIELFEGQSCLVHVKLTDEWEVYGGTPKGEFRAERESADSVLVTVPAMEADFTPLVPYELFARRTLDGREWLVLSGQLHVRRRYSDAGGGISPVEYFVEPQLVEDGISSSPQIIVGIPGPQGPKGEKGDTGEGGMTEAERATLAGAAQRAAANTFSAANTFTGSVDMSTAQVTPPEGWNVGELTAEQVQSVVPMAWDDTSVSLGEGATTEGVDATAIGAGARASKNEFGGSGTAVGYQAKADFGGVAVGEKARVNHRYAVAIGNIAAASYSGVAVGHTTSAASESVAVGYAAATGYQSIAIGVLANASVSNSIGIGNYSKVAKPTGLAIGACFTETVDGETVSHTCTTEGTGSITIGAGANTLNNGSTESSNSVTIGCKAENKGADSVVIGAQASNSARAGVAIGAGVRGIENGVSIGANAKGVASSACFGYSAYSGRFATVLGNNANGKDGSLVCGFSASAEIRGVALGEYTKAKATQTIAIGAAATVSDYGATVIRSTAEDGTYTQLYFSGANTPLANTYEGGEAMMGYVVRDSAGNIMVDAEGNAMVGTQKLSVLFPNNRGENAFTPAMLSMDDDWTPKPMFRPSDLDMSVEEPSEVEEYKPLPVWPIVEPDDIMGDNGTLEQGGTENTSPETNS